MLKIFELIGRYFILMGKVFSRPEKRAIYRRRIIYEMESLGLNSIGLTAIISVFIGAVITLQMSINLESPFIPKYIIGYATRETMILEFSSTVVALILAGKVGSSIASEIGTMRITEQIDALEIMGVNSASYLILPKIVATVLFFPFLAILSILIGIAGGYLISALTGIMIPDDYVQGLLYDFRPYSITYTLIKMAVFAFIITSISAFYGYYAKGNSLEVGAASTKAVVARLDRHHDLQLDSHPNPAYMIKADHISKSFDGRVVLDDVSVEFDTGTTNLVIGKSGSGKTVLLKCLVGLHEVDSGSIWYDDIDFTALGFKERKAIRRDIGMLFQGGALLDSSTVEENVKASARPLHRAKRKGEDGTGQFLPPARAAQRSQSPLPRRTVGRYDQACGYRPGHRTESQIPLLRRTQLGPRPPDFDRDRQPDPRDHPGIRHHHDHQHPRYEFGHGDRREDRLYPRRTQVVGRNQRGNSARPQQRA